MATVRPPANHLDACIPCLVSQRTARARLWCDARFLYQYLFLLLPAIAKPVVWPASWSPCCVCTCGRGRALRQSGGGTEKTLYLYWDERAFSKCILVVWATISWSSSTEKGKEASRRDGLGLSPLLVLVGRPLSHPELVPAKVVVSHSSNPIRNLSLGYC